MAENTEKSEIDRAIDQLYRSELGRATMKSVLDWLEASGMSLDAMNQSAVLTLLLGAWGSKAGTVLDALRNATRN